ncbi:MAG: hypothetical protein ACM3SW_08060 [Actinomycetota bacterium]
MKQEMFVDVEVGFSEHNLDLLNKAVNAFAEFDTLVSRVLALARQGHWPREFALVTIAYYSLHRHKDDYQGKPADDRTPVPPVRLTVELEPATQQALRDLLTLVEAHPPVSPNGNGQDPTCAFCLVPAGQTHAADCGLERAITQARSVLRVPYSGHVSA